MPVTQAIYPVDLLFLQEGGASTIVKETCRVAVGFDENESAWVLAVYLEEGNVDPFFQEVVEPDTDLSIKDEDTILFGNMKPKVQTTLENGQFCIKMDAAERDKLWEKILMLQGCISPSVNASLIESGSTTPPGAPPSFKSGFSTDYNLFPTAITEKKLPIIQDIVELRTNFDPAVVNKWLLSANVNVIPALMEMYKKHQAQANEPDHSPECIEGVPVMQLVFMICRAMIMMNDREVLGHLLSDNFFLSLCEVCESNPWMPPRKPMPFVDVIKNVRFRHEVFSQYCNNDLLNKITTNYRIKFLQDSVLTIWLPAITHSWLTEMVVNNNFEIVDFLFHFSTMPSSGTNGSSVESKVPPMAYIFHEIVTGGPKREYFEFLKELLDIVKASTSHGITINAIKKLWRLGLPLVLNAGLSSDVPYIRSVSSLWLSISVDVTPTVVRQYMNKVARTSSHKKPTRRTSRGPSHGGSATKPLPTRKKASDVDVLVLNEFGGKEVHFQADSTSSQSDSDMYSSSDMEGSQELPNRTAESSLNASLEELGLLPEESGGSAVNLLEKVMSQFIVEEEYAVRVHLRYILENLLTVSSDSTQAAMSRRGKVDGKFIAHFFTASCKATPIKRTKSKESLPNTKSGKDRESALEDKAGMFLAPLLSTLVNPSQRKSMKSTPGEAVVVDLLEFVSFCLQAHSKKMYPIISHCDMIGWVVKHALSAGNKNKTLFLAGVRFIRACIHTQENAILANLVKNEVMYILVGRVFSSGRIRQEISLIHSTLFSIFQSVYNLKIQPLIGAIVKGLERHFQGRMGDFYSDSRHHCHCLTQIVVYYHSQIHEQEQPLDGVPSPSTSAALRGLVADLQGEEDHQQPSPREIPTSPGRIPLSEADCQILGAKLDFQTDVSLELQHNASVRAASPASGDGSTLHPRVQSPGTPSSSPIPFVMANQQALHSLGPNFEEVKDNSNGVPLAAAECEDLFPSPDEYRIKGGSSSCPPTLSHASIVSEDGPGTSVLQAVEKPRPRSASIEGLKGSPIGNPIGLPGGETFVPNVSKVAWLANERKRPTTGPSMYGKQHPMDLSHPMALSQPLDQYSILSPKLEHFLDTLPIPAKLPAPPPGLLLGSPESEGQGFRGREREDNGLARQEQGDNDVLELGQGPELDPSLQASAYRRLLLQKNQEMIMLLEQHRQQMQEQEDRHRQREAMLISKVQLLERELDVHYRKSSHYHSKRTRYKKKISPGAKKPISMASVADGLD